MNQNEPVFPVTYENPLFTQTGLTKLEYFSIECLKNVVSASYISDEKHNDVIVKGSINLAKKLLKQLEDEK